MATKKVTLNELQSLIKQIVMEEYVTSKNPSAYSISIDGKRYEYKEDEEEKALDFFRYLHRAEHHPSFFKNGKLIMYSDKGRIINVVHTW